MKATTQALQEKIQELLIISEMPAEKFNKDFSKGLDIKMNQQDILMEELKHIAKAQSTVIGRILKFPCADSYSYYVVTNVHKSVCDMAWVRYCDEWVDDRLGIHGTLDMNYVYGVIKGEDNMEKMFPPRQHIFESF